jgi:phosphatidylserine/phosphatidylglycerophosphate/cardiolipin synthase-like enzyme
MQLGMKRTLPALLGSLLALVPGCALDDGPGDQGPEVEEAEIDEAEQLDGLAEEPEEADAGGPTALAAELRPGCTARGTLAGHPIWLHFTRPPQPCTPTSAGTPGVDTHVLNELVRLIDSVPAGGRIDGNIFNITIERVAASLLRAQDRGVTVAISTDRQVGRSTSGAKTKFLDKLRTRVYCGTSATASCVSSAADAIAHTKLFVFSAATAPDGSAHRNVSWFGSANQTSHSGQELFNNTVTVYGDTELYNQFRTYLRDLFNQARRADYYDPDSGRGHILAGAADAYVSPESTTDLVVNRLDDVTPDASCRVRVMHASIRDSRMAVVNRIIAMKRGGCKVWVVANTVEPQALAALKGAGISVREHIIHDKMFAVFGKYGSRYEFRVYTGSHNLSASANRKYDEIFVKLAPETGTTHPIYDAYFTHFNDAYNNGRQL